MNQAYSRMFAALLIVSDSPYEDHIRAIGRGRNVRGARRSRRGGSSRHCGESVCEFGRLLSSDGDFDADK